MATQKSIHYKVTVTKGLLQNLAIAAWLLAVLTQITAFTMAVVGVDREILQIRHTGETTVGLSCSIAIVCFNIMVYR